MRYPAGFQLTHDRQKCRLKAGCAQCRVDLIGGSIGEIPLVEVVVQNAGVGAQMVVRPEWRGTELRLEPSTQACLQLWRREKKASLSDARMFCRNGKRGTLAAGKLPACDEARVSATRPIETALENRAGKNEAMASSSASRSTVKNGKR